jgi:hypothetical protein
MIQITNYITPTSTKIAMKINNNNDNRHIVAAEAEGSTPRVTKPAVR